jgi:hypothetical protein
MTSINENDGYIEQYSDDLISSKVMLLVLNLKKLQD